MHYDVRAFAIQESKPTIKVLNPDDANIKISRIGKTAKLSGKDIEWARKVYCKSEFVVTIEYYILNVTISCVC